VHATGLVTACECSQFATARNLHRVSGLFTRGADMPNRRTIERAKEDKREEKSASTQAGEFVREEIHHIREGKHGARSTEQAIAIGLSKARRAGVHLPAPEPGTVPEETRRRARRELALGRKHRRKVSRKRSRAVTTALEREAQGSGSSAALAAHAKAAARRRSAAARSASARKAARTRSKHEKHQ
jgi:hypothetical protein